MAVTVVLVVGLAGVLLAGRGLVLAVADVDVPTVQEVTDNNLYDVKVHATTEIIKQMLNKRCLHSYSIPCLKLDLARLVDRLSGSQASFQVLPGVSLSRHNTTPSEEFPVELAQAMARDHSHSSLDNFLVSKVGHYLGSLTLSVRLAEPVDYLAARALSSRQDEASARAGGKRRPFGGLLLAALLSAGTLLTLGLAALAAMSGKALMTSLAALLLAALSALKGSGSNDHKSTTYEIITKPVVSHAHSHSAEVQHEHGGHHGYAYGRSMDFKPVLPADSATGEDTKDSFVLAYRAHRPTHAHKHPEEKKKE